MNAYEQLKLAGEAIAYTLRRTQTDPDFREHMLLTETLAKLCTAHAAITGVAEGSVLDTVLENHPPPGRDISRLERVTTERDRFRDALDEIADKADTDARRIARRALELEDG